MSGRKRKNAKPPPSSEDPEYLEKRRRNNEAVHRSREKTRQLEAETAVKVNELKTENADLERRVEVLNKELGFLKEMFVAYASGKGKEDKSKNSNAEAVFSAMASDPTPPSANTRQHSNNNVIEEGVVELEFEEFT